MMQKSRVKLFIENFIVYGFGGAINKIIPFVMIIIITRLIPDSSYIGIAENTASVVQFAFQVALLGVLDAMFRYFFENETSEYQKRVTSSALKIVMYSGVIVSIIMIVLKNPLSQLIYGDEKYSSLVIIAAVNSFMFTVGSILATPTRMRNQRGRYIALNAIVPLISYGLSVPLILSGWYTLGMPLAAMVSSIVKACLFYLYNKNDFSLKDADRDMERKLLRLGVPIMPSFVFYWIINSSQRIVITNLMSLKDAGVYSTGAKLAQVSQLIYIAFTTGWQYFAFSTMKNEDHKQLISRTSEYLGGISFFCCCIVVILSTPIVKFLFPDEYLEGAIVLPALFLAPLVQMIYQSVSSQFLVIKKTGYGLICLSAGAIIAIILEIALLPVLGIAGPALGALAGFIVAYIVMIMLLLHYDLVFVYKRTWIGGFLACASVLTYTCSCPQYIYICIAFIGIVVIGLMFYKDVKKIIRSLYHRT